MKRSAVLIVLLLALTSCTRGSSPDSEASPTATVEVTMRDDNTYNPPEIEVEAGETVRFVIKNEGKLRHEFLIGTVAQHEEHETQMAGGGEHEEHGGGLPGLSVAAGDEQDFTFTFSEKKDLIFGCHEIGHFAAGMRGEFRYRA